MEKTLPQSVACKITKIMCTNFGGTHLYVKSELYERMQDCQICNPNEACIPDGNNTTSEGKGVISSGK